MSADELKDIAVIHAGKARDLCALVTGAIKEGRFDDAASALPNANHAIQMTAGFVSNLLIKGRKQEPGPHFLEKLPANNFKTLAKAMSQIPPIQ